MDKRFVVQIPKEDEALKAKFLKVIKEAQKEVGTIEELIEYLDGRGLKYDLFFEATEHTEEDWELNAP